MKLCSETKEKIGVLGQFVNFFLEISSATVYMWKVVIAFKSRVLVLFISLFYFPFHYNLLLYYFITIIKLSLSQPISFLNFIFPVLSSHQGGVSR